MSISGEATLPDMLGFFSDFLKAAGYVFEGGLEIATGEEAEELVQDRDFWKGKYVEMMRVAGGEKVEELEQDRDFWQEQTYKLLRLHLRQTFERDLGNGRETHFGGFNEIADAVETFLYSIDK